MYRIKGWYYLMCAEGGTERNHSEVIFRAKSPWGPFEPYANNPILTQRDLAPDRTSPWQTIRSSHSAICRKTGPTR